MTKVTETSKVQVNYTGSLPDSGLVFDTSVESVAKEHNIFNEQREYKPLDVTVGEHQVIPGFENALIGMEVGEKKTVVIPPEEAYGMPDPENVVQVEDAQFKESNIPIQEGVMIQTNAGIAIMTAYDEEKGLITLDFNHQLAGQTLKFELELIAIL